MNASMHSCIYIFISFYLMFTSCPLCVSYLDLAIHVLPIFLSCMLLLIHIFISYTLIFIYFPIHASTVRCFYTVFSYTVPYYLLCHAFTMPILRVHVLIPVLCHLLLISIILIIYAFLSCVPSMFHHIHFGMSIIYSYHIRCIYISFFIYF